MPRPQRTAEEARLLRDFGYRLRALREERGMTQMDLAHRAGLHPTYIGQVEGGLRNVALLNVVALAAGLQVAPAELMPPAP